MSGASRLRDAERSELSMPANRKLLEQAQRLANAGNTEAAEGLLSEILVADALSFPALSSLVSLYHRTLQPPDLLERLNTRFRVHNGNPEFQFSLRGGPKNLDTGIGGIAA